MLILLSGILNRNIINSGVNVTKHKKTIILLSCFIMMGVSLIYAAYTLYLK